jgi:hypothetical protein
MLCEGSRSRHRSERSLCGETPAIQVISGAQNAQLDEKLFHGI